MRDRTGRWMTVTFANDVRSTLRRPELLREAAYIGGQWIPADGAGIAVNDPFDGSLLGYVPNLGAETARHAIEIAEEVQLQWRRRNANERSRVLRQWCDLVVANVDDLAQILTAEQGKPLAEARGEILGNAGYLEWYAEEAKRIEGDVFEGMNRDQRIVVLK